jgi:hypothetical protein
MLRAATPSLRAKVDHREGAWQFCQDLAAQIQSRNYRGPIIGETEHYLIQCQ